MKQTDFIALQAFGSVPPLFSFSQEPPPPKGPDFDERPITGWRGRALTALGDLCSRLADRLEDWSRHLRRCPDCGRSRFYGGSCQ